MDKKKIVSIEDKIPNLKQARTKKTSRRLIFYLSIFFILISIIIYLQSPLSNVKDIEVQGNKIVSESTIIKNTKIDHDTNMWEINSKKINKEIENNPTIKSVNIKRQLPSTILIDVLEYKVVGYVKTKDNYSAVLENGKIVTNGESGFDLSNAPLLHNFKDDKKLKRMTEELNELPDYLFNMISEIFWIPSKNNEYKIEMFMIDGFTVNTTIREFSKNMEVYPSIVSQLEINDKGIIHVGENSYFESEK